MISRNRNLKYHFFIIGTGGTGTWVLKNLSLYFNSLLMSKNNIGELHLYDGDTVEEKNLRRQTLFDKSDEGCNKAIAIARVLNDCAFTLNQFNWYAHPNYILPSNIAEFKGLLDSVISGGGLPVIISCVDNNAARLLIEKTLSDLKSFFLIDTANGDKTAGEVFFTSKINGKRLSSFRSEIVRSMADEELKHVNEMSCEELNTVLPQHIFTNMESASRAVFAVANLIENGSFPRGAAFFDTSLQTVVFRDYPVEIDEKGEVNSGERKNPRARKKAKAS